MSEPEPTKAEPINWKSAASAAIAAAALGIGLTFGGCIGTGVGYKLAQWGPKAPVVKPADPKPTDPVKPDTTKIPVGQARVVIVRESGTVTVEESNLYSSRMLNEYLDSVCLMENRQPAHRLFDKDGNFVSAARPWRDAMERLRKNPKFQEAAKVAALPANHANYVKFHAWIVVSADDRPEPRFEGPLPTLKAAELIEFIKKFTTASPSVTWAPSPGPVVVTPPLAPTQPLPQAPVTVAERD